MTPNEPNKKEYDSGTSLTLKIISVIIIIVSLIDFAINKISPIGYILSAIIIYGIAEIIHFLYKINENLSIDNNKPTDDKKDNE